jgi:uncharacterized protein YggT (Ycf19 family)
MVVLLHVIQYLRLALLIFEYALFAWVILTWVLFLLSNSKFRWRQRKLYNSLEKLEFFLRRIFQPVLRPIRRMLRRFDTGRFDWAPLVLFLVIELVRRLLEALAWRLILNIR